MKSSFSKLVCLTGLAVVAMASACGTKEDASSNPSTTQSPTDGTQPQKPGSFGSVDAGGAPEPEGKCETLNIGILGVPGENDSSNFQVWLKNAGTTANRVLTGDNDPITAAVLAPFDVVVVDHLRRDVSDGEAAIFQTWLSSGKGAMTMTGYLNAPEVDFRANPLLAKVGLQYVTPRFDGPVTDFMQHPTTQGLTEITFLGGYAIHQVDGSSAARTVVAKTSHGDVGYAAELGTGRAFVWGDEWIQFDSEWTTLPEVQQFWVQIFGWLAPNRCKLTPQQPR